MTNLARDLFRDFGSLSTTGLSDLFNEAQSLTYGTYPPSNLIEFVEEGKKKFLIEIAVAGFAKSELTIEKSGDYVHIKGAKGEAKETTGKFLHRGLATRDFHLRYLVAKFVEVGTVKLVDGVLKIELEYVIPEEEKSKIFEIL
jgi:molecular chaperone IbpA